MSLEHLSCEVLWSARAMEWCGALELWSAQVVECWALQHSSYGDWEQDLEVRTTLMSCFFIVFKVFLNMNLLKLLHVDSLFFFVSFFFSSLLFLWKPKDDNNHKDCRHLCLLFWLLSNTKMIVHSHRFHVFFSHWSFMKNRRWWQSHILLSSSPPPPCFRSFQTRNNNIKLLSLCFFLWPPSLLWKTEDDDDF